MWPTIKIRGFVALYTQKTARTWWIIFYIQKCLYTKLKNAFILLLLQWLSIMPIFWYFYTIQHINTTMTYWILHGICNLTCHIQSYGHDKHNGSTMRHYAKLKLDIFNFTWIVGHMQCQRMSQLCVYDIICMEYTISKWLSTQFPNCIINDATIIN